MKLNSRGDFSLHYSCQHLGHCLSCTACSQACVHPSEIHTHKLNCSNLEKPETNMIQQNGNNQVENVRVSKPNQIRKMKCLFCGKDHQLGNCSLFLKRSPQQRTSIVRTLDLCYRCFSTHARNQCPSNNCILCGGLHNELLCYKVANKRNH